MRCARNHFHQLYHEAPVGYLVLDENATIIQANKTFSEMIGSPINELEKGALSNHLDSESQRIIRSRYRSLFKYPDNKIIELRFNSYNSESTIATRLEGRRIMLEGMGTELFMSRGNPAALLVSVTDITLQKENEAKVLRLAHYDDLTGLSNRKKFLEKLSYARAQIRRSKHYCAVLFMDLDRFKLINDSLGHGVGDALLKEVASRVESTIRDVDVAARLGGDEFVILLWDVGSTEKAAALSAEIIAEKVRDMIRQPCLIENQTLNVTTSIGVTLFGDEMMSNEEVLKKADHAMYMAKGAGKNKICFYQEHMQKEANERLFLEKSLRNAVRFAELMPYYQGQFSAEGDLVGVELLLRWPNGSQRICSPDKFITMLEETSLIYEVWKKTLSDALLQIKRWKEKVPVSINLSPAVVEHSNFLIDTERLLTLYNCRPGLITFEVTESLFLKDIKKTSDIIHHFRRLGVRFSLDDFGTGYSSLRYLKNLPIDEVKIDRSFVMEISNEYTQDPIINAIINLSQELKLKLVAEGVETEAQFHHLREKNCQIFQGYYFAKAMSAIDLTQKFIDDMPEIAELN